MARQRGRVFLVGAGPGDPGLITVKGLKLLRQADVVVHDRLIPHELLDEVKPDAQIIDVGKYPGRQRHPQDQINALLIEQAGHGSLVVRLKGGDPLLFGRGWEEFVACAQAGVRCEIVPGVTSALAVPASANIPITLRKVSRAVAIVTAQSEDGRGADALNYDALAGMETIVVLMGLANVRVVAERLVAAGRDPHTPAACIERGTMPQQRVVTGNLETIANLADEAQLESPTTTVIGDVVRQAALCSTILEQSSIFNQTLHPLHRSSSPPAASA